MPFDLHEHHTLEDDLLYPCLEHVHDQASCGPIFHTHSKHPCLSSIYLHNCFHIWAPRKSQPNIPILSSSLKIWNPITDGPLVLCIWWSLALLKMTTSTTPNTLEPTFITTPLGLLILPLFKILSLKLLGIWHKLRYVYLPYEHGGVALFIDQVRHPLYKLVHSCPGIHNQVWIILLELVKFEEYFLTHIEPCLRFINFIIFSFLSLIGKKRSRKETLNSFYRIGS